MDSKIPYLMRASEMRPWPPLDAWAVNVTHFQLLDSDSFDEDVGTKLVVGDGDDVFPESVSAHPE